MNKKKRIISIIVILSIIIYIIYAICLLVSKPNETYIIKKGTISDEESSVGYIIRNEEVVRGENYENGIYTIASEGKKVAKSDSLFRYYNDSEKEISNQMKEIDYKIQELMEQEKSISSADIKAIENQLEEKLKEIRLLNNYQEIMEYKNSIDSLINKKINFIGDASTNSEIRKLVKEKKQLDEKLKNGSEYKIAPSSGIVSYRVDGLEEQFSTEKLNEFNSDYLEQFELKTGQIIATSSECGKIIDNFKCYIVAVMDSQNAKNANVGDKVQIRISAQEEIDATIIQINEESGKRTIIFQLNTMNENLINHRKIEIDVIWWNESGLKVPNQSLIEENGLFYLIRKKSGTETKILVKIEKQTEKFSIVSTYSTTELQNIGYDEKDIKSYKKINNYDEILLNPNV